MFDLTRYLGRIGLAGVRGPALAELHRAHVTRILFENLDPLVGIPVSLEPDALARKLVDAGRGGYCFEQNLLFKAALEALGAKVEPMLARVRVGRERGSVGPLTHLLLRVHHEGATWHADAGFGSGTLLGRWCRSAFCGALGALWGVRGRLADGGRWRNADRLGLGDRVCRAASGSDGR